MRSIVIAFALATSMAAPLSAVAAAPNTFTTPDHVRHQSKPAEVFMTFQNTTSQDRELVVGDQVFKIRYNAKMKIHLPVGSVVRMYSETNSKINGQQLMEVSQADDDSTVRLK